ncbi:MAG: hypothetical protein KF832_03370 [Caldilineaceae bacterium]|nr:hypothetical protein [Caldilineaceae bacterium]
MDAKMEPNTEPIRLMLQQVGAKSIFGEPIIQGGVVVIPVAQVQFGFGYGGGYGHSDATPKPDATTGSAAEGGGGGGGAGGHSAPRGFIRIAGDEVKFEPITDENRIPLAGILMVAWSVFWVTATIRVIAKVIAKTQQTKWKLAKEATEQ